MIRHWNKLALKKIINHATSDKNVAILAIIISFFSAIFTYQGNSTAQKANELSEKTIQKVDEANKISAKSYEIANEMSDFERRQRSQEIVDKSYEDIFYNNTLYQLMNAIIYNRTVSDPANLNKIVDIFEDLGSKYCKGLVDGEQIRASFANPLYSMCTNDQIHTLFSKRKNALALLCYKFIPKSRFSEAFVISTINTCNFLELERKR